MNKKIYGSIGRKAKLIITFVGTGISFFLAFSAFFKLPSAETESTFYMFAFIGVGFFLIAAFILFLYAIPDICDGLLKISYGSFIKKRLEKKSEKEETLQQKESDIL